MPYRLNRLVKQATRFFARFLRIQENILVKRKHKRIKGSIYLLGLIATFQPILSAADDIKKQEPCSDYTFNKQVFFGDLHVHTAISFDATVFGTRSRPVDAYRFARGEPITFVQSMTDAPAIEATISRPLDFAAITDHAEQFGHVALCQDKKTEQYASKSCKKLRKGIKNMPSMKHTVPKIAMISIALNSKDICGESGELCVEASLAPWRETVEAAQDANLPCQFTSFAGYEYSGSDKGGAVHRNIIFRNKNVLELPISQVQEPDPLAMLAQLEKGCNLAGKGCDALSIPHNPNLSNGRMFALDYRGETTEKKQAELAALRARMEPVVEMMQVKGESECRNDLWKVIGAPDEFCDFEKFRQWDSQEIPALGFPMSWVNPLAKLLWPSEDCEMSSGAGPVNLGAMLGYGCHSRLDFVRTALAQGIAEEERIGVNPYKFGLIGSSDEHNGLAGDVEEWTRDGVQRPLLALQPDRINPGGLVAVWAPQNTRDAIFDGLRAKETYATSGPRMQVRFFGSWNYPLELCNTSDFVEHAYANGVAMGGNLPERPRKAIAPRFVLSALRDPGTPGHSGGKLQRMQIVKVWPGDNDELHQQVFDVAGGANDATVDLKTCEPNGEGLQSMCAVWQDPEFEIEQGAAYYARVLENPSCRAIQYHCAAANKNERHKSCDDPAVPKSQQERAWTSPIWYSP